MSEHNNPAGRLSEILSKFQRSASGPLKKLAEILGVPDTWNDVMPAVMSLREEGRTLSNIVEEMKDSQKKYNAYRRDVDLVLKTLDSFDFNLGNNSYQVHINESGLTGLSYIALDIDEEQIPTRDELESLRRSCDELRNQIHSSKDLPKHLKKWLLELVLLMRTGLDRYQIQGNRGLREQLHKMVGIMLLETPDIETVKQTAPDLWAKFSKAFSGFSTFADYAAKGAKAIQNCHTVFSWLHDSSGPPQLPSG